MLIIENLSVRVAGRLLLDEATVRVPAGSRTGLVGRNGTGKTTLFNVITGDLAAESGDVYACARTRAGRAAGAGSAVRPGEPDRQSCSRPTTSGTRCWTRPSTRPIRTGSPRSRPGWPTSTPIRRRRAPPRSCRVSAFDAPAQQRAVLGILRRLADAGGAGGRPVRRSPTCCCSTSRPTISTSKARCGWRTTSRAIRTP